MDTKNEFKQLYDLGISAFEKGAYRLSIEKLQQARQTVGLYSPKAAEAGIWLVSAYEGMGESKLALELCRELAQFPNLEIRKQAQQLLYILEAPQLKRPEDWTTKIPDLEKLPESKPQYQKGSYRAKPLVKSPPELGPVNSKDNYFISVALVVVVLSLLAIAFH
jgi:hypothetical protein